MDDLSNTNVRPAEAIYAFAAWLTTREKYIAIGANFECGRVVKLVEDFRKSQNWELPRDRYTDYLLPYPNT